MAGNSVGAMAEAHQQSLRDEAQRSRAGRTSEQRQSAAQRLAHLQRIDRGGLIGLVSLEHFAFPYSAATSVRAGAGASQGAGKPYGNLAKPPS